MPKHYPIQETFEAGELSPLLYSRSDLPIYNKGAVFLNNCLPNSRGPIQSRNGFEFKGNVGDPADTDGRLFTFRVSASRTYIVAVTDSQVWITDENGLVESDNILLNGDFLLDGDDWIVETASAATVGFNDGICALDTAGNNSSVCSIRQMVTGLNIANIHKVLVSSTQLHTPIGEDYAAGIRLKIGTTERGDDVLESTALGEVNIEFNVTTIDLWVEIECSTIVGSGAFLVNALARVSQVTLLDITQAPPGNINFPSVWTAGQINELQAEMAPDLQQLVFVHRDVAPQVLTATVSAGSVVWAFEPVVFVPVDPFYGGFPGAITFHHGRMILASTRTLPVTIWASQPGRGNYFDFTLGTGGVDTDAIEVALARNADIQWVRGSKVLYVGCDNSEHVVTSDGPVLTATNIQVNQQSAYGSGRIQANFLSDEVSFVSHDRRRIRLVDYVSDSAVLSSSEISWAAEHITAGLVAEIHQAKNPLSQIWAVLSSGTLISCTYDRQFGAVGWARHGNIFSNVKSITIAEENGISAVYALVFANDGLRLFRMGAEKIFMDGYVNKGYDPPQNEVDGLEHLEGFTVQIIADGSQREDQIVLNGVVPVTGPAASSFQVGIKIDRRMETMIRDTVSRSGSTAGHKKRWNEITVRILDSAIPIINGKREATRVPQDEMNSKAPNRTEDVTVHNLGWDKSGSIVIEQDLPYDMVVVGVHGSLAEEKV